MNQTILVTGCAGFIGSRVCELLLADDYKVVGIDNLNDAYDVRLKQWRLDQLLGRPRFEFHRLDLGDRAGLAAAFAARPDAVINLAARAGVRHSLVNPFVYLETNVVGTLNLLEHCREAGVSKFILASTSSLYGSLNPVPFSEEQDSDHPLSPYAASKKAAESLCYSYHYLYGIDVTVFRYFTVYGPAGRPDMSLFRFVQAISEGKPIVLYGDGSQSRDFTYVDDIAHGTVAGLKPVGFEVINLGSDCPAVLMDAIRLIEEMVGKAALIERLPRHSADVLATWANIRKAEHLLGWRPRWGLQDGLQSLVNWYMLNREWAKKIRTSD